MSTVGVVLPSLGERLGYLEAAVASLATQSLTPASVVVVPAARVGVVQAALDGFGTPVIAQTCAGISPAIEQGWKTLADVDYLAWLGDDDLLRPGAVQAAADVLDQHPTASAVVGRCDVIDADGQRLYTMASGRAGLWLQRFGHNLVMQPGSLFRRTAVETVGGLDPGLQYVMDYDLLLRLRRWGPVSYVPRTLAAFRWHAGSTTAANQRASFDESAVVRRRYWRGSWWEPAAEQLALAASKPVYWIGKRRVR